MRPGDYGLTTIRGPIGLLVSVGQALTGDGSRYQHAYIVVNETTCVGAHPGGARLDPLAEFAGRSVFSDLPLTGGQRAAIVDAAKALVGTPYSFLDYLALALHHLGIKPKWLTRYIKSTGHMICSQLVDECYRRAGVHLFKDGRLPQDVTPGDLTYVGNVDF